jgi:hypothetical protein
VDDELERELRRMAEWADPVPADLVRAAAEAFVWRASGCELAELVYDSLLAGAGPTVRSGPSARLLTFEGAELTVEVEIGPSGTLIGQLLPPGPATVQIRRPSAERTLDCDEYGRFAADRLEHGPLSLRCTAGETKIVTDWIAV